MCIRDRWLGVLQQALGRVQLTHRECRHLHAPHLGANPVQNLGLPSYANNAYMSDYVNKALLPSLMPDNRFIDAFGFDRNTFYEIRDTYVQPLLVREPHRENILTSDAITALYLIKLRDGPSFRFLGAAIFGVSHVTCTYWFHKVADAIFVHSEFLHRIRNTGNNATLRQLYEEAYQATCANDTLTTAMRPVLDAYEARNPHMRGLMKVVVFSIDSLTIACNQMSEHSHKKKNYSSKISKQGLMSTVVCSADGLPKYITNMSSSSSPSCTDERILASLIDLEAGNNPLITGGLRTFLTGPLFTPQPGQMFYGQNHGPPNVPAPAGPYHDLSLIHI